MKRAFVLLACLSSCAIAPTLSLSGDYASSSAIDKYMTLSLGEDGRFAWTDYHGNVPIGPYVGRWELIAGLLQLHPDREDDLKFEYCSYVVRQAGSSVFLVPSELASDFDPRHPGVRDMAYFSLSRRAN